MVEGLYTEGPPEYHFINQNDKKEDSGNFKLLYNNEQYIIKNTSRGLL